MDAAADRTAFAPPPQPGLVRGFALAVAAHLLLAAALTWGLRWDREPQEVSAEAELWSSLPQQAAQLVQGGPVRMGDAGAQLAALGGLAHHPIGSGLNQAVDHGQHRDGARMRPKPLEQARDDLAEAGAPLLRYGFSEH